MGIGAPELIILLVLVLLLFGATRLPRLARSLGQASKEFKKGVSEDPQDEEPKAVDRKSPEPKAPEPKAVGPERAPDPGKIEATDREETTKPASPSSS